MLKGIKAMLTSRLNYFNDNEIDIQTMADDISTKTGIDIEIVDSILFEETNWMIEKGFAKGDDK